MIKYARRLQTIKKVQKIVEIACMVCLYTICHAFNGHTFAFYVRPELWHWTLIMLYLSINYNHNVWISYTFGIHVTVDFPTYRYFGIVSKNIYLLFIQWFILSDPTYEKFLVAPLVLLHLQPSDVS